MIGIIVNFWKSYVKWCREARDQKNDGNENVPEGLETVLRIEN